MSDLETIIQRLKTNPDQREKAFEACVAKRIYDANNLANKTIYLTELRENPAEGETLTEKQSLIADAYQAQSDYQANANFGIKATVLAGILAATAFVYTTCVPKIKGTESHVQQRIGQYEEQNERYKRFHHGKNAPWYKSNDTLKNEAAQNRETGRGVAGGLGGILLAIGLAAVGYSFYNKKKVQ